MEKLLLWYHLQAVDISVLVEFHARYESIHPFQILFRECLKNRICPVIIEDSRRLVYLEGLKAYREKKDVSVLEELFIAEQEVYYGQVSYFMQY